MIARRFLPLLGLTTLLGGAVLWAKVSGSPLLLGSPSPASELPIRVTRESYDPALVHQTLEFYAAQTRYDPGNATFHALLAGQYLESYRETGDSADATRAEQAARASLKIRNRRNSPAYFQLSRSLLTQHRFAAALVAARQAAAEDPVGLRECADIEIELGDYQAAARDLARVAPQKEDPAYLALRARLPEIYGDANGQLSLLQQAVRLADVNEAIPPQSVAWFHERLGRALSMRGRLDDAENSYLAGIKVFPRDYRTMAALAHLYAARGDWKRSLEWGEKAADIVPTPETLALLGDAFLALGRPQQARTQFDLVEKIGVLSRAQGVIYDRQRALYYADHDRNLEAAVKLARGELRARHDIYAFDTLAWTLFKVGRLNEAAANSKRALAFGTRDSSLYFHAGMIAAAQKKRVLARSYLLRALAINPYFHPSQPAQARKTILSLNSQVSSGR